MAGRRDAYQTRRVVRDLTPEEAGQAKADREAGMSWDELEAKYGTTEYRIRCAINPRFAEQRKRVAKAHHDARSAAHKAAIAQMTPEAYQAITSGYGDVPIRVLQDRDRRLRYPPRPFGDPVPGQSALDRMKGVRP